MPDAAFQRRARRRIWWVATCVLAIGVVLAAAASARYRTEAEARVRVKFDREARRATEHLLDRFRSYERGLRGTRGVVLATGDQLTRRLFAVYAQSVDLATTFPGARGIGVAQRVVPEVEDAFVAAALLEQPYFALRQLNHHHETRWVVKYVEPERSNREAIGLDLASEPSRRSALERSISTGLASLTAPIRIVAAPSRGQQGLLLLLPVYEPDVAVTRSTDRRGAARGFAYATLLLDDVLASLDLSQDQLGISLADVTEDHAARPFYRRGVLVPDPGLRASWNRELYGRIWRMELQGSSRLWQETAPLSPAQLFIIGAIVAALLACLTYLLMLQRLRSQVARAQHEQLHTLFANSSDAIMSETLDGTITSWNAAAERVFGFSLHEVLGRSRAGLNITAPSEQERELIAKVIAGEQVPPFDGVWHARDGSERAVSVAVAPLRALGGAVAGLGLTIRDVSARRRAERELQEQSEALERLVATRTQEIEASRADLRDALRDNEALVGTLDRHALISITNRRGVITYANDEFCRISGYTREELVGRRHNLVNAGVHPPEFWVNMWRTIASGSSWRDEVCNRAKDGSLYYVDSIIAPFFDKEGNVDRYVSIRHDISGRRRATLELARERERLDNILRATGAATWEWNVQTGETRVNDRWARMIGHAVDDIDVTRIETWLARVHPEDLPQVQSRLQQHFTAAAESFESEYRLQHREGGWIWAQDRGAVITRTADGRPEWMYGTHLDVTARHQAEEALRRATADAEAANAAKSEFLANVSHEIRTPLNAVIGLSHLLERTPLNREQADYLSKIHAGGRHLLGVINDVLDLSKIEAGEMALEERAFDLEEVLDQLRQMLAPQARGKSIELEIGAAPSEARSLRGDAARLSQILTNLLSNAIKFTAQGRVALSIAARATDDGAVRLRCLVRDTGVGIAAEVQSKLFSPFTQADASTTRRYGGTGLGLSIVKRLSQMMKGDVGVVSELGKGSEFWAELELGRAGPAEASGAHTLELLIVLPEGRERDLLCAASRDLGWQAAAISGASEFKGRLREYAARGRGPDLLIVPLALEGETPSTLSAAMQQELAPELVPSVLVFRAYNDLQDGFDSLCIEAQSTLTPSHLFDAACAAMLRRHGNYDRLLRSTHLAFTAGQWLSGVRVLLVDDSDINVEVARSILEREGALVAAAYTGVQALAHLRANPDGFDVVLMDVQMPEMDGNEATERIRRELKLESLPIIALTAGALVAQRQRALAAGVNDFLTKPLDPNALVRSVHFHVRSSRQRPLVGSRSVHEAPAPASTWLPIEGIDMELAVVRTMQSYDLFCNVLDRIVREYAPLGQDSGELSMEPDVLEELQRRMHKLRGSSGMIGATELQLAAGAVEDAIADGVRGDPLQALFLAAARAFARVSRSAGRMPATGRQVAETGVPSSSPVLDLTALRALRSQLVDNDLQALSQFEQQRGALATALGSERFVVLNRAIQDLHFEEALDILDDLGERRAS